jgi:hypothetical protein
MSIYWRCSLRVYWLPILALCFVQASGASQRCPAGAVLVGVMSPIQATINAMVSEPYGSPLAARGDAVPGH